MTQSPIVELNRAMAVAMADGPAAGLAIVDGLMSEPALKTYHLLPSVRGDLLVKLGRLAEARPEFERAAAMTRNARERELLLKRAGECRGGLNLRLCRRPKEYDLRASPSRRKPRQIFQVFGQRAQVRRDQRR